MKNKLILLTATFILLTANAGYTRSAVVNDIAVKFVLAMAGVIISSIVIYAGLAIYNKIISVPQENTKTDEILKTPKTTDEAIKFFINKNRLK